MNKSPETAERCFKTNQVFKQLLEQKTSESSNDVMLQITYCCLQRLPVTVVIFFDVVAVKEKLEIFFLTCRGKGFKSEEFYV